MARRARSILFSLARLISSYLSMLRRVGGARSPAARGVRRWSCSDDITSTVPPAYVSAAYAEDNGAEEGPGATAAATTAAGSAVDAPVADLGDDDEDSEDDDDEASSSSRGGAVDCLASNLALR